MGLSDLKPSNMSAFIRGKLPEIEAAIASGVSHESVWGALKEQGLTLTFNGYMSAVSRARKARGEQPMPTPPTKTYQATQAAPQPIDAKASPAGSLTPEVTPDNPPKTPLDPYSAAKARHEIQSRDYSDLEDDRYK